MTLLLPSYIHQIITVICDLSAIKPTFEMLDDNIRLILEKHAPLHSCGVAINQNDSWYNAMKSDIILLENIGIGQNVSTYNI